MVLNIAHNAALWSLSPGVEILAQNGIKVAQKAIDSFYQLVKGLDTKWKTAESCVVGYVVYPKSPQLALTIGLPTRLSTGALMKSKHQRSKISQKTASARTWWS